MTPTASSMGVSNTTSTYAPNPQAMSAYSGVLNTAQGVGQIPYTPYQGQMVAGFTPDQLAAFQGVREMQGIADPYINAATGMVANASNALTPEAFGNTVESYYNPYQQNVINAAMANMQEMNASQQNQLTGNAIMSGAMGGDRAGIARAELARQQAMTNNTALSSLQQQGWQDAVKNALSGIGAQQSGAYSLGQLGSMLQNSRTAGLSALLGTGAQQQALGQQQLQSMYDQFLMAQGYPYQQTGWLAGITGAIGPNMGGTTYSSTTGAQQQSQAGPSLGGQIAGFGTTALAMAPYVAKAAPYIASAASTLGPMLMASDRRAKTDVQSLGDGLYAYRYKGDPKSYPKVIGEMAQEVEKTEPDRVVDFGGIKGVLPRRTAADGGFMDYFDPQYLNERMKSQWVSTDDDQSNPQDGGMRARGGPVERGKAPNGLGAATWIPDVELQPGHAVIPQAEAAKFPDLPSAAGAGSSSGGLGGIADALNKPGGSEGFGKMLDGLFGKQPMQLPGATAPSPVDTIVQPDPLTAAATSGLPMSHGGRVGYSDGGAPGGLYASWAANAGVGDADGSYRPPALAAAPDRQQTPSKGMEPLSLFGILSGARPAAAQPAPARNPIGYFSNLDYRRIDPASGLYAMTPSVGNDWSKSAYYMPKYAEGGRVGLQYGGDPFGVDPYMGALAKGETGGESDPYAAIGPETRRGDHAYGKYQIMGTNIPSWSQEAGLGRLTPEQFLADKDVQEKIARYKFGQYLKQTGSPVEAARMWFGGPKYRAHAGATDAFGTSVPQYAARFERNLGSSGSPLAYAAAEGAPSGSARDAVSKFSSTPFSEVPTPGPLAYAEGDTPRPGVAPPRPGVAPPRAAGNSSSVSAPAKAEDKGGFFDFSPEVQQGLLAAGLGMLSSRSPWAGVAIGEGGLKGLEAYQNTLNRSSENKVRDAQLQHYKTEDDKARFEMEQLRAQADRLKRFQELYQGNNPYGAPGAAGSGGSPLEDRLAQIDRMIPLAPNDDERQKLSLQRQSIVDQLKRNEDRATPLPKERYEEFNIDPKYTGPVMINGKGEISMPGKPMVNIDQTGETEQTKIVNKGYGELLVQTQAQGRNAGANISRLDQMERLVNDPKFYSGQAEALITSFKRGMGALGVEGFEGSTAPNELFASLSNKMVLEASGGSLGPGISNSDILFLKMMSANSNNSKEGNLAIIDAMRKMEERKKQVAKFARDYAKSHNGMLDIGYDDALAEWAEANPLFPKTEGASDAGNGAPSENGDRPSFKPPSQSFINWARENIKTGKMTREQFLQSVREHKEYDPATVESLLGDIQKP